MLPKQYRLNLRTERNRVTQSGKTFHSSFFTIIIAPQNTPSISHFSAIVSTKFHPHAVKRHQAKRLIYQIIRDHLDQIPPGRDYIIIPKKDLLNTDKNTISKDLLELLRHSR